MVIVYPWHPWVGKNLTVINILTKHGAEFARCIPSEISEFRKSDIPLWMFDPVYCKKCKISTQPFVSPGILDELAFLLENAFHIIDRQSVEKLQGDADEKDTYGEAGGIVSSGKAQKHMGSIPPQTQRQATKILARLMHQYFHPQNGSMRGGADDE